MKTGEIIIFSALSLILAGGAGVFVASKVAERRSELSKSSIITRRNNSSTGLDKFEAAPPSGNDVRDENGFPRAVAPQQQVAPVASVQGVPTIVSVSGPSRRVSQPEILGYSLIVKASVDSDAPLRYLILYPDSDVVVKESMDGKFYDILPIDGGRYDLVVENMATGSSVKKSIGGFDKVRRMSASQLESILNDSEAAEKDKNIYFSFDVKNLVIHVKGLAEGEIAPKSLSAIWSAVIAQGWTVYVLDTPQYDEYNRIKSFTIQIM